MPKLSSEPISPKEFMEEFIPSVIAEATLDAETDITLGVKIDGAGGGEWLVHISGGCRKVDETARDEAAFTLVQPVEDLR